MNNDLRHEALRHGVQPQIAIKKKIDADYAKSMIKHLQEFLAEHNLDDVYLDRCYDRYDPENSFEGFEVIAYKDKSEEQIREEIELAKKVARDREYQTYLRLHKEYGKPE